jgi:MFS family permease
MKRLKNDVNMRDKKKSKRKFLDGISINVIILGIVSFITDISSEMIHPLLPVFIVSLGGTGLIVGLIGGLGDAVTSILNVISGYSSDKYGKRLPFVFSGYTISAISKLLFGLSTIWQHVLLLRPVERSGKGLRTAPRDAIIADSTIDVRGKAFGIHRAMDTFGAVIGTVLVLILFWSLKMDYKEIFIIAGIIGLVAVIPLFFVREKRIEKKISSFRISLGTLPKGFKFFLIVSMIFALGNFTYWLFLLKAQQSLLPYVSEERATAFMLLLYIWFNAIYTAFSIPSGILSDNFGRKNLLIIGYTLFGATCVGFALLESLSAFIVLFGLYGLFYALIDGTQRAFASDLVTEELRGTALGIFHTTIGLATLPAGIIAGVFWTIDPSVTFIYGALLGFLSALLFILLKISN